MKSLHKIKSSWFLLGMQCVMVELEHNAVVISKPEPKRKSLSQIGIDDYRDFLRPEAAPPQNFFFDLVFGPRFASRGPVL